MIDWMLVRSYLEIFRKRYAGLEIRFMYNPHGQYINFTIKIEDVYCSGSFTADDTAGIIYRFSMVLFRSLKNAYGDKVLYWNIEEG